MKLLAIDTSGPVCGVAVLSDDKILCEHTTQNKLTHSVNLMPMVDSALNASGLPLEEIDNLAVVVGPGSFTGVRIGVATVKGLAQGAGKLCIPVNALEALAVSAGSFDGLICPVQDARAGQVYMALFLSGDERPTRLHKDEPMAVEDLIPLLQNDGRPVLFVGDGMPVHREALKEALGAQAHFAQPHNAFLRPAAVAYLAALDTATAVDYNTLQPLYLRAPNAKKNSALLEAMRNA